MSLTSYCSPRRIACAGIVSLLSVHVWGGSTLGVEAQAYPAGIIIGGIYEPQINPNNSAIIKIAYNQTDRQDWGKHASEKGGGAGLGLGWKHWFNAGQQGWHIAARAEFWQLEIDWQKKDATTGSSTVLVAQPYASAGYSWPVNAMRIDLSASLGAEINLKTDGEDVGEGAIGLAGVSLHF